jgi:hypothetical protein
MGSDNSDMVVLLCVEKAIAQKQQKGDRTVSLTVVAAGSEPEDCGLNLCNCTATEKRRGDE